MIAALHAVQICLAKVANLAVQAVEVELVRNPPQHETKTNQQRSGDQPGQQGGFEPERVQVHFDDPSAGIR